MSHLQATTVPRVKKRCGAVVLRDLVEVVKGGSAKAAGVVGSVAVALTGGGLCCVWMLMWIESMSKRSKLALRKVSMTTTEIRPLAIRIWMEDGDESYSVEALNLPGAVSCGDTQDEAIANIKEAALSVIEVYEASSESVPWKELSESELSQAVLLNLGAE